MLQNGTFRLGGREKLLKKFRERANFLTKSLVTSSIILNFVTEKEPKTTVSHKEADFGGDAVVDGD